MRQCPKNDAHRPRCKLQSKLTGHTWVETAGTQTHSDSRTFMHSSQFTHLTLQLHGRRIRLHAIANHGSYPRRPTPLCHSAIVVPNTCTSIAHGHSARRDQTLLGVRIHALTSPRGGTAPLTARQQQSSANSQPHTRSGSAHRMRRPRPSCELSSHGAPHPRPLC